MPVLVPCGVRLRSEFNVIAPGRDKESDGWIGDAAHQAEKSDHNPDADGKVHAIDVDDDLRESDLTMEKVVQFLLGRCRSGAEKRLKYIIYNRRIWEASNGWRQRAYTGPSPHTEHAHFSFSYDTAREASTASWHLEDIPVAMTDEDKTWMQNTIGAMISSAKAQILAQVADVAADAAKKTLDSMVTDYASDANPKPRQSLYDWTAKTNVRQGEVCERLADVEAKVDQTLAAIVPPAKS